MENREMEREEKLEILCGVHHKIILQVGVEPTVVSPGAIWNH